jgi:predicted O-methyltransferase YrrM
MTAVTHALGALPGNPAVVEVGSFCGRSTVVLGSTVKALDTNTMVYAIDPHEGVVGGADVGVELLPSSLATCQRNISANGLSDKVEIISKCSYEVLWDKPIGFLFIDGLHDYANIRRDFRHFEPWLLPGAYIAFHDYDEGHAGVTKFVNELLAEPHYQRADCAASIIVLKLASYEPR